MEPAKPSPGLDYTFACKAAAYDPNRWDCPTLLAGSCCSANTHASTVANSCAHAMRCLHACRKDIAHIWELAGGEALSAQLTQGSHTFLTHRQVGMLATCVLPGVLSHGLGWHRQTHCTAAGVSRADPRLPASAIRGLSTPPPKLGWHSRRTVTLVPGTHLKAVQQLTNQPTHNDCAQHCKRDAVLPLALCGTLTDHHRGCRGCAGPVRPRQRPAHRPALAGAGVAEAGRLVPPV